MTGRLPAAADGPGYDGGGQPAVAAPPVDPMRDPYTVYLAGLSSTTSRDTMRGCLDRIARLLNPDAQSGAGQPWHLLRYEHTTRIRAMLTGQAWSPSHVNKHLVALRRVLKEAWRLGLMTAEEYHRAADVKGVKATRLPAGQHVPAEAIAAVLAACDDDETLLGLRDGALLAAMYSTGCRRAELAAATIGDYDGGDRSLRVVGKGDKQRLVYLTTAAAARMEAWIAVRGRARGALLPRFRRGSHIAAADGALLHITPQAVRLILANRIRQAGASHKTPHDFRRTLIGELLDAGVDLATVQGLVGHASPATTARYDRRPERARREAVDRLNMPEPRRLRP